MFVVFIPLPVLNIIDVDNNNLIESWDWFLKITYFQRNGTKKPVIGNLANIIALLNDMFGHMNEGKDHQAIKRTRFM